MLWSQPTVDLPTADPHAARAVCNQPPPLVGLDLFARDRVLVEAVRREGAGWAEERLAAFGAIAGKPETLRLGVQANEHRPVLRTHDRTGARIDEVEFHPAWHALLGLGVTHVALLVRHAPPAVADAFCASRLDDGGHAFGTLPPGADLGALIDRHDPNA